VATVLVPAPTSKATIEGHKLLDSLVTKFPLNTFSTPTPTPEETSAPSVPTLKELLLHVSCNAAVINVQNLRNIYDSGLYAAVGMLSELWRMQACRHVARTQLAQRLNTLIEPTPLCVHKHHSRSPSQLSKTSSMRTHCTKACPVWSPSCMCIVAGLTHHPCQRLHHV